MPHLKSKVSTIFGKIGSQKTQLNTSFNAYLLHLQQCKILLFKLWEVPNIYEVDIFFTMFKTSRNMDLKKYSWNSLTKNISEMKIIFLSWKFIVQQKT